MSSQPATPHGRIPPSHPAAPSEPGDRGQSRYQWGAAAQHTTKWCATHCVTDRVAAANSRGSKTAAAAIHGASPCHGSAPAPRQTSCLCSEARVAPDAVLPSDGCSGASAIFTQRSSGVTLWITLSVKPWPTLRRGMMLPVCSVASIRSKHLLLALAREWRRQAPVRYESALGMCSRRRSSAAGAGLRPQARESTGYG